jgi:phosphatidylserine decarboxylase
MRDALIVSILSALPRNRVASWMGVFARTGISRWFTRAFVWAYGVDMSEAEHPASTYTTLDALFTRRLKPGMRPISDGEADLVSPVDGTVAWVGTTERMQVQLAPKNRMTLEALLGKAVRGDRDVAVLYLSPKDYHRVHVPREGRIVRWRYLPGTLWPVFPAAVREVDGLFTKNERAVVYVETAAGVLAVVMVGAFGVGRMTLAFDDFVSNDGADAFDARPAAPLPVARGDDLGVFHLGSTVILVAPKGSMDWRISQGDPVRMGQCIATAEVGSGQART